MPKFTLEKRFTNKNGTLVRLISEMVVDFNDKYSIWTYAHYRKNENEPWVLCRDQSDFSPKEIKEMPREQYLREGRTELLEIVGTGELLKASQELLNHAKQNLNYEINPMLPFGGEKNI